MASEQSNQESLFHGATKSPLPLADFPTDIDDKNVYQNAWQAAVSKFRESNGKSSVNGLPLGNVSMEEVLNYLDGQHKHFDAIVGLSSGVISKSKLQRSIDSTVESLKCLAPILGTLATANASFAIGASSSGNFVVGAFALLINKMTEHQRNLEQVEQFFEAVGPHLNELEALENVPPHESTIRLLNDNLLVFFTVLLDLLGMALDYATGMNTKHLVRKSNKLDEQFRQKVLSLDDSMRKLSKAITFSTHATVRSHDAQFTAIQEGLSDDRKDRLRDHNFIKENFQDIRMRGLERSATLDILLQESGEIKSHSIQHEHQLGNLEVKSIEMVKTQDGIIQQTGSIESIAKQTSVEISSINQNVARVVQYHEKQDKEFQSYRKFSEDKAARDEYNAEKMQSMLMEVVRNTASTGSSLSKQSLLQSNSKTSDSRVQDALLLRTIQSKFSYVENTRTKMESRRADIIKTIPEQTGRWILETNEYQSWLNGEKQILRITDATGISPSYLSDVIIQDLTKNHLKDNDSVAYWFFSNVEDDAKLFKEVIGSLITQISEQNVQYRRMIVDYLSAAKHNPWKALFKERFGPESPLHLYLVFDSIDKASEKLQQFILTIASTIIGEKLRIHILFTAGSNQTTPVSHADSIILHVDRQMISKDMKILIDDQFKNNETLNRLRRPTKKLLREKLRNTADSMTYINMMTKRLARIGREPVLLKDIDTAFPPSLEMLFEMVWNDYQRAKSHSVRKVITELLSFLAHCKRDISLSEACEMVNLIDEETIFDLEAELIGGLSEILKLDVPNEEEDSEDNDEEDSASDSDSSDQIDHDTFVNDLITQSENSTVNFTSQAFREYMQGSTLKDQDSRLSSSEANFTIFLLLTNLVFEADDMNSTSDGAKKEGLFSYATQFWAHHFVAIDLENTSKCNLMVLLDQLRRLVSNESDFLNRITKSQSPWNKLDQEIKLKTQLQDLLFKCQAYQDDLSDECRQWLDNTNASSDIVFRAIAKQHVEQWLTQKSYSRSGLEWYDFAREALILGTRDSKFTNLSTAALATATYFKDVPLDCTAYYQIAMAYLQGDSEAEQALLYAEKAFAMANSDHINLFRTHHLLATVYHDKGLSVNTQEDENWYVFLADRSKATKSHAADSLIEKAVYHIDEALKYLPDDERERDDLSPSIITLYGHKGLNLQMLGRWERAKAAYNHARSLSTGLTNLPPLELDLSIWVHDIAEEPSRFFDYVQSWTCEERKDWFDCLFENDPTNFTTFALHNATFHTSRKHIYWAKLVGERGKQLLLQWAEDYLENTSKGSLTYLTCYDYISAIYLAFGNRRKAIDRSKSPPKLDNNVIARDKFIIEYFNHSTTLSWMFEEFRCLTDPRAKLEVLEEFRQVASVAEMQLQGFAAGMFLDAGPVQLCQAHMTRVVGSTVEYEKIMRSCFDMCVNALTDQDGTNDVASFNLLAKVLGCMPGLERDAQIAASSRLYISDPSVSHEEVEDDADGSDDEEFDLLGEDEEAENEPELESSGSQTPRTDRDHSPANFNADFAFSELNCSRTTETATGEERYDFPEVSPGTRDDHHFMALTAEDVSISGTTEATSNAVLSNVTPKNADSKPTTVTPPQHNTIDETENTEDLAPIDYEGGRMFCDGCGKGAKDWSQEPFYLCLHCLSVDLCQDCLMIRLEMNKKLPEIDERWMRFCGDNHQYVKAPVKGWKGIKNGIMTIGDETITFKEWLRGLKEERWPKAWQNFWLGESSVQTFGHQRTDSV